MDPNEKLLFQDPFHEVKRKRDKKKEVPAIKDPVPLKPRNPTEQPAQGIKSNTYSDRNPQRAGFVRNGEGSARNSEGSVRNRQGSARNREFPGRDSDHFVRNREGFVRNREGFARNWQGFARNKEGFARNTAPELAKEEDATGRTRVCSVGNSSRQLQPREVTRHNPLTSCDVSVWFELHTMRKKSQLKKMAKKSSLQLRL